MEEFMLMHISEFKTVNVISSDETMTIIQITRGDLICIYFFFDTKEGETEDFEYIGDIFCKGLPPLLKSNKEFSFLEEKYCVGIDNGHAGSFSKYISYTLNEIFDNLER